MAILNFQKPDEVILLNEEGTDAAFEFRPLEPGYGLTVGNALRRVLLSSLEGYAITSIKIDGADHEFSTLKGVVQDVTEIVLNLKQVRFKQQIENIDSEKAVVSVTKSNKVTAGDIAAAGAISLRLSQMTGWVSYTLMSLYTNIGEVEDGMRTLSPPHDLIDAHNAEPLRVASGKIHFKGISFAYNREIGGVDDISLTIGAGEKVGLVGASGAGKSTLVSLLLRLYDPEKGSIYIDDQNLRSITQESLRSQIGMVTQETALFNRSARDNILYGRAEAKEQEVVSAAKQAEAHQFILNLKDHNGRTGYQAHLGEQGVKLSGGQRQRIALARAILKDAPILVLDEATSALDTVSERMVQNALDDLSRNRTALVIAHRLSTVVNAHRLVVLERGRVVEVGSHADLLARDGAYKRYHDLQDLENTTLVRSGEGAAPAPSRHCPDAGPDPTRTQRTS